MGPRRHSSAVRLRPTVVHPSFSLWPCKPQQVRFEDYYGMNRLSWYTPAESMEEILRQAGNVGIYDGDAKQSAFEQGTLSLTLQRVIWADSSDPDCRLILHHSLIDKVERHHKSMFSRGGKVILHLKPTPPGHPPGPVAASAANSLRFIFKSGGEDDFYKLLLDALSRQTWKRTSSSSSSAGSRTSHVPSTRGGGISGIEKRLVDQHNKTHENISQAFEDMKRLRMKKGESNDDETTQFKSYLLSLGVSDPVTKTTFGTGAIYFEKLAQEITDVLLKPLEECGGTMTLPEAYCRINRARGVHLISPEDLLNACQKLDAINSPITMFVFDSGVNVVQLRSVRVDQTADETAQLVQQLGSADADKIARHKLISPVLAKERLLAAEAVGKICRDDSVEGLFFYPNLFLTQTN
uniref:Vacuolar protein-sorting-associated protein 36 n=1 Tax=Panagrellus redivivus TaxID=6233 RepID=A0A7E4ZY59_PANRE